MYYCWIKISFNSNPESFQILADEIGNNSMTLLIRVWRYQSGNQNPYIKEQTTQWWKEKVQKEKQWSTKHVYKAKGRVTRVPLKTVVIPGASEGTVDHAPLVALDVFLINYLHWWCNVLSKYYNEQSNIAYSLYIHSISSLEEKSWMQSFYNKSLLQFITILSNSRKNISYKIIFTFNNQIVFLQH